MNKSQSIAKGGLLSALTVILIYLSNIIPTSKLTILTIASALIPLAILSIGVRNAFVVYLVSTILSLFLGLKGSAMVYGIFFGTYGFIKYYLEGLKKATLELPLKIIFFNICLFLSYFIYKSLFLQIPNISYPIYIVLIGIQVAFIVYDYALTIIIAFINRNLR